MWADDVPGPPVGRVDPLAPDEHLVTVRHGLLLSPLRLSLSGSAFVGSALRLSLSARRSRLYGSEQLDTASIPRPRTNGPPARRAPGRPIVGRHGQRLARTEPRAYGRGRKQEVPRWIV